MRRKAHVHRRHPTRSPHIPPGSTRTDDPTVPSIALLSYGRKNFFSTSPLSADPPICPCGTGLPDRGRASATGSGALSVAGLRGRGACTDRACPERVNLGNRCRRPHPRRGFMPDKTLQQIPSPNGSGANTPSWVHRHFPHGYHGALAEDAAYPPTTSAAGRMEAYTDVPAANRRRSSATSPKAPRGRLHRRRRLLPDDAQDTTPPQLPGEKPEANITFIVAKTQTQCTARSGCITRKTKATHQ